MKKPFYLITTLVVASALIYIVYISSTKTFNIENVSVEEVFKVYKETNRKLANIDLFVNGTIDSAFNVRVVGFPLWCSQLVGQLLG